MSDLAELLMRSLDDMSLVLLDLASSCSWPKPLCLFLCEEEERDDVKEAVSIGAPAPAGNPPSSLESSLTVSEMRVVFELLAPKPSFEGRFESTLELPLSAASAKKLKPENSGGGGTMLVSDVVSWEGLVSLVDWEEEEYPKVVTPIKGFPKASRS